MKYLGNLIMRELLTRIWNDCPISQMSHVLRASPTYSLQLFDKDGGVICSEWDREREGWREGGKEGLGIWDSFRLHASKYYYVGLVLSNVIPLCQITITIKNLKIARRTQCIFSSETRFTT